MDRSGILWVVTCGTAGHILPALVLVKSELTKGKRVALIIDIISAIPYRETIDDLVKNYILQVYYNQPFNGMRSVVALNFWISWWKIIKQMRFGGPIITFICGKQIHVMFSAILFNRKRLYLHEQDSVLNKTNRIGQFFKVKINSSFLNVKYAKNPQWIGCPIDCHKDKKYTKKSKIITILAGTNGAEFFDGHIPLIMGQVEERYNQLREYKIYHNCKKANLELVENLYKKTNLDYIISPYFHNFTDLIANSDFLITRGGASTISYLAQYEKNSIIIPWKDSAQSHQLENAKELASVQGAILLEESQVNDLVNQILYLFNNSLENSHSISMGENIAKKFKIVSGKQYLLSLNL